MTARFTCSDCGDRIMVFGLDRPPAPPRCQVCAWLLDAVADQAERERLRAFLTPPVRGALL